MSLILKGIDLPKKIKGQHGVEWECETYIELYVRSDGVVFDDDLEEVGQAIQIDRPHGRLIDADLFKEIIKDSVPSWAIGVKIPTYGDMDIMDKIYFIPTILEAEGER